MELNKIYQMDCIEGMKRLEDESVDLIIADPPYYKIVKEKWDNRFDTITDYLNWCMEWTIESYRVLKDGGQFYVWGAVGRDREHPFIEYMLRVEKETEFKFINWITMKNFRVFGNSKHFPFARQELIVFSKGKHVSYSKSYSDFEGVNRFGKPKLVSNVWVDCKDVSLYNRGNSHPTEKPSLSSERIIQSSSREKENVLIPFVGSGVDCVESLKANRNFIGFEIESQYIDIAQKRIEDAKKVINL